MARLKAIKEMIKNSKDEQTLDMFPDDLTKAKGAELKKTMLGQNKKKKKKKRKKRVKKGEQTTMEFGAGGKIAKYFLGKRKKKLKEKKRLEKTETKSGDVTTFNPDAANVKKAKKIREEKQKAISDKINPKYAGGGKVKKEREKAQQIVDEGYAKVKARREKAKRIVRGDMNPKKYAGGGKVTKPSVPKETNVRTGFRGLQFPKKSIDGIAQRGLTRAKHK